MKRYEFVARDPQTVQRVTAALLHECRLVSGDPYPIDAQTWAIHGFIPVDGDVILAEFDNRADAYAAIALLWDAESP